MRSHPELNFAPSPRRAFADRPFVFRIGNATIRLSTDMLTQLVTEAHLALQEETDLRPA